MKLGIMNDPWLKIEEEILFAAENGFDFIDLTLEPPHATTETLNHDKIHGLIKEYRLGIVGHTAFYLPFDSLYPELRKTSAAIILNALESFTKLRCEKVTVHFNTSLPNFILKRATMEMLADLWSRFLEEILPEFERRGVKLMLENCPSLQDINLLRTIFSRFGAIGFHLDIGHANIGPGGNKVREILHALGNRLIHVHMSDNFGQDDLHLPIGAGNIEWRDSIDALKRLPYDDTITLEIFSKDRDYLKMSRDKIRKLWADL